MFSVVTKLREVVEEKIYQARQVQQRLACKHKEMIRKVEILEEEANVDFHEFGIRGVESGEFSYSKGYCKQRSVVKDTKLTIAVTTVACVAFASALNWK